MQFPASNRATIPQIHLHSAVSKSNSTGVHSQQILNAHFFDQVEQLIVSRLHNESETDQGRAELVRSTGADDPVLIKELIQLGITADGLVALRLFPMVWVAWAEENATPPERKVVMAEALKAGVRADSVPWVLLDHWLKKRPPAFCVDAWKRYLHGSFVSMTKASQTRLIETTQRQMTAVAKASGGVLGIGSISRRERNIMNQLLGAMHDEQASGQETDA